MKKTLPRLRSRTKNDLIYLMRLILKRIPQTQMIILYGSYATGKYVLFDERVEFGVNTYYVSDYDILVVTQGISTQAAGHKLDNISDMYHNDDPLQAPVQFINEDIHEFNKQLSAGRYFYTEIKRDGIMLYDSGNFKLVRRRKLKYDEIKEQAEEYYEEKYQSAYEFLEATTFFSQKQWYRKASFILHQSAENLFHTVRLVFTLKSDKQHNLLKLLTSVRRHSPEFQQIFPRDTKEEKRLFDLLKAAYVEGRYNPEFVVTPEDLNILTERVEKLSALVKRICQERIEEYGKMI